MSNYSEYWDRYVTQLFPKTDRREGIQWPGDEWGNERRWKRLFGHMFEPCDVAGWEAAVEIGQGAGKYTRMVFDAAPRCSIAAFDVSAEYLKICGERLGAEQAAGRLHLNVLEGRRADEMVLAIERLGLARKLDAFYSMDAMVHVDLQYLVAYWLTAALTLKPGGYLIMTLADATSEDGFNFLVSRISRFYSRQGQPVGKFEWLSKDIVRTVLPRLGFEIVRLENPPGGRGRDIQLTAKLVDPEAARAVSGALCEGGGKRRLTRHSGEPVPEVRWDAVDAATAYAVEFSVNKFASLSQAGALEVAADAERCAAVPAVLWAALQGGQRLYWRVMAQCPDRARVAAHGILLRTDSGGAGLRSREDEIDEE